MVMIGPSRSIIVCDGESGTVVGVSILADGEER
jgi:hypothetical protein